MARRLDDVDAEAGEALDRVVGSDGGDDPVNVSVHRAVVDRRLHGRDAEGRAGTHELRPPARRNQGLGWHAAVVEAVAAHLVLLDERDRDAELGGGRRNGQAARAAADDAEIDAQLAVRGAAL